MCLNLSKIPKEFLDYVKPNVFHHNAQYSFHEGKFFKQNLAANHTRPPKKIHLGRHQTNCFFPFLWSLYYVSLQHIIDNVINLSFKSVAGVWKGYSAWPPLVCEYGKKRVIGIVNRSFYRAVTDFCFISYTLCWIWTILEKKTVRKLKCATLQKKRSITRSFKKLG
jgi:hypothetical protein